MKKVAWVCVVLVLALCAGSVAEEMDAVDALIAGWRQDMEALGHVWGLDPAMYGSAPREGEAGLEEALRAAVVVIMGAFERTAEDLRNHHVGVSFFDTYDGAVVEPVGPDMRAWYFVITNRDREDVLNRGFFVVVDAVSGEVAMVMHRGANNVFGE